MTVNHYELDVDNSKHVQLRAGNIGVIGFHDKPCRRS